MRFVKNYFRVEETAPPPLVAVASRRIRFEEVDQLGMVWHGRYASYLEDGRIGFGDTYGLRYQTFAEHRVMAPVVQFHIDYKRSLRFDEKIRIETALSWSEAVRLDFSYIIYSQKGEMAATGYTVQLLTSPEGEVILLAPQWLREFKERWQEGYWQK